MVVRTRQKLGSGSPRRSRHRRRSVELAPLLEEYRRERVLSGAKAATMRQDQWALRKLQGVTETLPIDRPTALRIFDGNLSASSREQLAMIVKRFFRWAQEVHDIPNPIPDFKPVSRSRSLPRVLTDDEITKLLGAAQKPSNLALALLILDTGIRIGEVANLTKHSIVAHSDRFEIEVDGKTGMRRIPISADVARKLMQLGGDMHIWTKKGGLPIVKDSLQKRFRRMMERAAITGRRLGPHTLRHTFGTNFIRQGGDVVVLKDLLGHTSIEMTQKYVTLAAKDLHESHSRFVSTASKYMAGPKLRPAPHVTVCGAVETHVEEEWQCEAYDRTLMDGLG